MDIESRTRDGSVSKEHGSRPPFLQIFIAIVSVVVLILVAILVGNISTATSGSTASSVTVREITPNDQPLGLPGMSSATWNSISKVAQTQVMNFYLYSPNGTSSQTWVDNILGPHMKTVNGVTINRLPAVYQNCSLSPMAAVCNVSEQVSRGLTNTGGNIDLIWINGVNFENMKKLNLLYGPWATSIPNAANFDFSNPRIAFDKGVAISGLEFPFNGAQSVFIYNTANFTTSPPRTVPDLVQWIKNNPNQFTYADPSLDFTGACFIRLLFYYYCADNVGVQRTDWFTPAVNQALYAQHSSKLWAALNDIEPFLYRPNRTYFQTTTEVLELSGTGQNTLAFSFNVAEATQRIDAGTWPATMQAYVFTSGTIADTNYLAIPINAANKEAALVTVNHIASAHSLFQRAQSDIWGALQVYNPDAPEMFDWDVAFDHMSQDSHSPTISELSAAALPDVPAALVDLLNSDWVTNVRNA